MVVSVQFQAFITSFLGKEPQIPTEQEARQAPELASASFIFVEGVYRSGHLSLAFTKAYSFLFSEKFQRFITQKKGELIQNCFRHEKTG